MRLVDKRPTKEPEIKVIFRELYRKCVCYKREQVKVGHFERMTGGHVNSNYNIYVYIL